MKNYRLWLRVAAVFQFLTGLIHAASIIVPPAPQNDSQKQLMDMMQNLKLEIDGIFHPSMQDLTTALSACYSLLCIFGGLLSWYFLKKNLQTDIFKGFLTISVVIFGICFTVMLIFTFLPPIILTGIIFVTLLLARLTIKSTPQIQ